MDNSVSLKKQTLWGNTPAVCGRRCKHIYDKEPWIKCTCK